jgi:phosphodiesterase/alkaline phosphatase D-like protein
MLLAAAAAMTAGPASAAPAPQAKQAVKITDGPRVEGTGDTWAVVAWTTNTGGSTLVRYGTDKNSLNQVAQAPYSDNEKSQAQNHRVHINNLKPNTAYYFMVDSGQGEGTGTEAKSSVQQFQTKAAGHGGAAPAMGGDADDKGKHEALKITDGPRVEGAGKNWAVVAWTTNTGGSTVVKYGTDKNSLNQVAQAPYSDNEKSQGQNHRVHINNLKPNTTYYYRIVSGQGEGTGSQTQSAVETFQTKAQ